MSAEIIVAADVPSVREAEALLNRLSDDVRWYKVGLELFCADGPAALAPFMERGRDVFLDLKLHDIPNTVARAVKSAAAHGARMITVHAAGGRAMLEAAAAAAREIGENRPKLLAVTMLTSLDVDDLTDLGIGRDPADHVAAMAELAVRSGIDGLVCSVREAAALRERFGQDVILVTPGIRMLTDGRGDQKRVDTPVNAVRAGADYLVVGRAITQAPDPEEAARQILGCVLG